MARPLNELGDLGAQVARLLERDQTRRDHAIATARHGLLDGERARYASGATLARLAAVASVLALAAVALLWGYPFRSEPLRFQVDGAEGTEQVWLGAPGKHARRLAFSDGSVFEADSGARLRVVSTAANGAEVDLGSGMLHAKVTHSEHSAWRVTAGPFTVRVTGTEFVVGWTPSTQVFSLAVSEGSVVVSGSVAGSAWPVRAGDKLLAFAAEGRVEVTHPGAEEPRREMAAPTSAPSAAEPSRNARTASERHGTPADAAMVESASPVKSELDWREIAKSGDLKGAYAAAEQSGFKGTCATASAAELLLLGDAARLAGRADRATEALSTLRRRYPRDPRRAAAAFALGKVAFDARGAYREAADWFATSMREAPSGPLAREAAGRRLEALRRAGDQVTARAAATDYLTRYPDGPHAEVARAIVR